MVSIISRRSFIKATCCSVAALGTMNRFGLINALASTSTYRALVCVFLFGGNDGNQMIVPLDSRYTDYSTVRGSLAIAQGSLLPITTLDSTPYGLHPNLPEIQTLYNSGQAAFIANVGPLVEPTTRTQYRAKTVSIPENLYSHQDQQNENQNGSRSSLLTTTGWGGRVADLLQPSGATFPVSTSVAGNTLFLTGVSTSPATIIPGGSLTLSGSNGTAGANARDTALQQLLTFDSGLSMVQAGNTVTQNGLNVNKTLKSAFAGATPLTTVFPTTGLGKQLQQIAQIIQVRDTLGVTNQIFFASLGGFDTHSDQLNEQDPLLTKLSQALSAFYNATVELGVADSVTTFTQSDFARTCQPNTNGGTDHAWGNHQMVLGGAVKGGDLYGTFPTLELSGPDDAVDRGIWIPTTSVEQYGATLASWLGVGSTDLATVFPDLKNFTQQNLGFV